MTLYAFLKILHYLSAMLLLGTGLGSAFYLWRAHQSGNVAAIAVVSRQVVLADWLFTTPAVILQPLTGVGMALLAGYALDALWLKLSLLLYGLAVICWLPVLWLQGRMRDLSMQALNTGAALPAPYHTCMRAWFLLGWPAFLAMLAIIVLMVVRPQ